MSNEENSEFDQFFERYSPSVRRYITRNVGDEDEADDIHAETFIKLYHHWPADPDHRRNRAFQIAYTTLIDSIRAKKKKREYEVPLPPETRDDDTDDGVVANEGVNRSVLVDPSADLATEVERRELHKALWQTFEQLTPEQRDVMYAVIDGERNKDLTEAWNMTPGGVTHRIRRAAQAWAARLRQVGITGLKGRSGDEVEDQDISHKPPFEPGGT